MYPGNFLGCFTREEIAVRSYEMSVLFQHRALSLEYRASATKGNSDPPDREIVEQGCSAVLSSLRYWNPVHKVNDIPLIL
jgi:hypothetical protein